MKLDTSLKRRRVWWVHEWKVNTLQVQVDEKVTHLGPKEGSRFHWASARGTCRMYVEPTRMWRYLTSEREKAPAIPQSSEDRKNCPLWLNVCMSIVGVGHRKCFALAFFPKIIISSHISQNDCSAENITLPVTSFMLGFVVDQWWSAEADPWRDNEPLQHRDCP